MLNDLLDQLNELGVQIAWARELTRPGLWLEGHNVLVLNATATAAMLLSACDEVLESLSPPLWA